MGLVWMRDSGVGKFCLFRFELGLDMLGIVSCTDILVFVCTIHLIF
jgi:hypothetical protein